MKGLLFVVVLCLLVAVYAPVNVFGQCTNGTVWSQLGADDATRLQAVSFLTDRTYGFLAGDECMGFFLRNTTANFVPQLIAFIATAFGGNILGVNNNYTGIAYRIRGVGSNPVIQSEDLIGLFTAMALIHQPLGISQQENNALKNIIGAALLSAGIQPCLVNQVATVLGLVDSAIVANNGTLSRPCATRSASIQWRNPNTQTVTIAPYQTVCFVWTDSLLHSIVENSSPAVGRPGYGYAAQTLAVVNASSCNARPATPGPCFLSTGFSYCMRFDSVGSYNYTCGVHGNAMTAVITVSATAGTTTTTTGTGATSTTGAGGSTSTSAASSLRSWFGLF